MGMGGGNFWLVLLTQIDLMNSLVLIRLAVVSVNLFAISRRYLGLRVGELGGRFVRPVGLSFVVAGGLAQDLKNLRTVPVREMVHQQQQLGSSHQGRAIASICCSPPLRFLSCDCRWFRIGKSSIIRSKSS